MKVLVIGCGSIGRRHIKNLRALGHDVQVYDANPSAVHAIADELGWTSPRAPLTVPDIVEGTAQFTAPDAAMICTPAATHAAVAEQLRQGGYRGPLFVEKPLVTELADAQIFRGWPHPVQMVGYNWRFHPELAPLEPLASRGMSLHFDVRTNIANWPGANYTHPLLECSHEIDLACDWLGEPTAVLGGELRGGAWTQLQHPRGDSLIDVYWNAEPRRTVTAHLSKEPRVTRGRTSVLVTLDVHPEADGLRESYEAELRYFLNNVAGYNRCHASGGRGCSFAEGLRVVEICARVKELATA